MSKDNSELNRYQNRNNNFRGNDRRHNQNQNGFQRNVWSDRNRGYYEYRPERDTKDLRIGNRSDGRQLATHMPGIPVQRNQSSTPFTTYYYQSVDSNNGNNNNGSGEPKIDKKIDAISEQMSQMDLKVVKDIKDSKSPDVAVGPKEANIPTDADKSATKTESQSETKTETNVVSISTPNGNYSTQRRNTIGTVDRFNSFRQNYRRNGNESNVNQMNGHKFERLPNNRIQTNEQFRRNKGFKKYVPPKNDFIPNYYPTYVANGVDQSYNPYAQYLIPNPLYSSQVGYGIPPLSAQINPNSSDPNHEPIGRKPTDLEQTKLSDPSNSNDSIQYTPHFLPFEPSPQFPVPPLYYGNVQSFSTTDGQVVYYFISMVPPNIAPLALDTDSNGTPILPSNCHNLMIPYSYPL